MAPSHVPLHQLSIDQHNIRHAGTGAEPVYVATIEQHGIIEPLIVRPGDQGFYVMQGGKRLASLQLMAKEGKSARGTLVTGDYPVPVVIRADVKTAAEAIETSLVTAICHMPIHPVDQYEAFAALADMKGGGMTPDAIALRFGCTRRIVDQRLALGRLSPRVRDAFRSGTIHAETAAAFTLAVDHKQQDRAFDAADKKGWLRWGKAAGNIKREIAGKGETGGARLVLVGVQAYQAAGGKVTVDLFNPRDSIVSDPALLQKMAGDVVAVRCAALIQEGWSWAVPREDISNKLYLYGEIKKRGKPTDAEKSEIERLTAILKALERGDDISVTKLAELALTSEQMDDSEFDDEIREALAKIQCDVEGREFADKDKARSGCTVSITQDGRLLIAYGITKPVAAHTTGAADTGSRDTRSVVAAEKVKKPDISNSLAGDMKRWARKATEISITTDTYKDDRTKLLAQIVADSIDSDRVHAFGGPDDKDMAKLRDQATPSVVKAAFVKTFDADRYFAGVAQKLRLKHLAEMGHDGAAPAKAGETIGLCKKLAASTSWLPTTLRWAHYDGPATGKVKAKAKAKRK